MIVVFWGATFVVAYVYLLYPALLGVWARLAPRPVARGRETPHVSIIVAARNEAERLPDRLKNLLELDYPQDHLQIIVVSDGSTDRTAEILRRYAATVDAVHLTGGGKARALNVGVARARHNVLVFADVRQRFAPDALRALVAPLSDPTVGGVSGELILDSETQGGGSSGIGEGIGGYWKYEKWLRRQESVVGSMMGATGAIYALRRELWQPLPENTILDDVLAPMRAVMASTRVVFEPRAKAFDTTGSAPTELRRKVRTLAGNFQILWLEPRLLHPGRNPVWLQYLSHKVGRLLVPYAMVALFVSSAVLAVQSTFYALAFGGQVAFYALAAYGAYLDRQDRHRFETVAPPAATPPAASAPVATDRTVPERTVFMKGSR
jgi:cellulose synthase/poly-beta-1,6-N-acetylglucosamine synthase-like glycosyltransferase